MDAEQQRQVFEVVQSKSKGMPVSMCRLGGGYYADVYLVTMEAAAPVVAKVYKTQGLMQREAEQIAVLQAHALFPMPEILWTHNGNEQFASDILAMEYLPGKNGGGLFYFSRKKRDQIGNQVIDNLLAWHNTENPAGFGEIGDNSRLYATWQAYYAPRAEQILKMAETLCAKKQLDKKVYSIMETALTRFDQIFCIAIPKSALIHGDYNMWNILADKKAARVTAVIDPCNCMWGDREMDLYQLENANGKHFQLLERYRERCPLSDNFCAKTAFYELFTEIEHYYCSGHTVVEKRITKQASALQKFL